MAARTQSDEAAKAEVIAAEELRCKAIADDDYPVVESLLADELSYRHATGTTEDKAQFMNSLELARRWFEFQPHDVRLYGDVAVLVGEYTVTFQPRDESVEPRSAEADQLQVWVWRDDRWQLTADSGATKIPRP